MENNTQTKGVFEKVKKARFVVGTIILTLVIFQAGVFVGYRKASFSYRGGENFNRWFGDRREGMGMMRGHGLPVAHGTVGSIIKINLPTLLLEDRDAVEKTVVIGKDTFIRKFQEGITGADLKVGDTVVVIGTPDEGGEINAKLIRVMPSISTTTPGSVSIK